MPRLMVKILIFAVALMVAALTAWCALALWYRLPLPEAGRAIAAGVFLIFGLFTVAALASRLRLKAILSFAVVFALMLFWWNSIKPEANAAWAPDVARQVTGIIAGNSLTLTDVRDFEWRSNSDFTERWTTRTFDVSKVKTVDLFMSYWAGPKIAHVIFSFGFEGGEQLAWSIEVRHKASGGFSPLADLFKNDPLVIVAADERDVVGVRSNVRGEDVQIYRLRASPEQARKLLLEYVAEANALAQAPQFYNSITTNCTTTVAKLMRVAGDNVPFDWRLIVNGYLPDYAYDRGAVDTSIPLSQLREISKIGERAQADGLSPAFSKAIRVGVPIPAANATP
ncbi:MAG: Lnb N-terminal periplasmic domain-containing protein [Shinella sp.]|uniref:Lnb N-terminal periplasmic domain-containing protein n=1 Tax=Shinella sp. TaxID=1870904 RepID=UPI0040354941